MAKQQADPAAVRAELLCALELDLVGPVAEDALAAEALPQAPSRWYMTGFLVPLEAGEEQRVDETAREEVDQPGEGGGTDDAVAPEPASARRVFFPSSMGMSLLVSTESRGLQVRVRWGDYRLETATGKIDSSRAERDENMPPGGEPGSPRPTDESSLEGARQAYSGWKRTQREAVVTVGLPQETTQPTETNVPGSGGLTLVVSVRPVGETGPPEGGVPKGTRSASLFLVNRRTPAPDERRDEAFAFQAELQVRSEAPLVPRPDLRGVGSDDWDERVADLQYHDAFEFAVGHGIATQAKLDPDRKCRTVRTAWIPNADVEHVAPAPLEGVELGMEALAGLADAADAQNRLGGLVTQYRAWIDAQQGRIPDSTRRGKTSQELLRRARTAAGRIEAGIASLGDPMVLEAFRIANRVMATSARRRIAGVQGKPPADLDPPKWRPFQLAFILMNLSGIQDPTHADREVVDLLFFPTGGGKTEAYFGLAAFALVVRRLKFPGLSSAGLSVLMRYTLRLLTLDQLGRAAALICALELERQHDPSTLGEWPFEIGLWVGRAATPNRMGAKGDGDSNSARAKTIAFKNDSRKPSPIPLEECPWCRTRFTPASFDLIGNPDQPRDLRVRCVNRSCDFTRERSLPILGVDEPIYRRLPCFVIATVDKFAAMPWTGLVGTFFGRVERADTDGFYGPCDPGRGRALPGPLPPPDLIIQDELHLISGPMGTMVALYETALDILSTSEVNGKKVSPKIVVSTATVRRAERQIQALFARREVDVFPPPGPDRHDSFFARVRPPAESHARLYLGIAAQGRSPKVLLLRTYLALLGAAQKAYEAAGGKRNKANPADPYMTLVGYFNSLRELGGSRRIVEDEVTTRLTGYSRRQRVGETDGLFADRKIAYDVVELTSRVSTDKVAEAKRRLASPFNEPDHVDVALATNMISVGLDIVRLGLMVVFGQPKTSAEYIQATSRVGRDPERPGLVVTLLNLHKPRDRSHYERFAAYHQSFYRSVEATGVTPFSPRALDRGLAGTLVALARLGHEPLTPPLGAGRILNERGRLDAVSTGLSERARRHAPLTTAEADSLAQGVRSRADDLLDEWAQIALDYQNRGVRLQYQIEEGGARRLLYEFLHPDLKTLPARHLKFRANRSMRDVEPDVNLWVRTLDDREVEQEDET